jgi:hypothetical protein
MMLVAAAVTVVVPLLIFIVPGMALVSLPRRASHLPGAAARVALWSVSLLTLAAFAVLAVRLPVTLPAIAAVAYVVVRAGRHSMQSPPRLWLLIALLLICLVPFAAFSVPFVVFHDGLPSGDSQKAILWAGQSIISGGLPDYGQAQALLNRDPVDFYTPGLHALTAMVMELTAFPLTAIGFLSIAAAVATALVGLAIALEIWPNNATRHLAWLAPILMLTHFRFLRYVREPGYHFQNILGEFLMFGLLLCIVRLLRRWRWADATLATVITLALALTHQFSAFLAAVVFLPAAFIAAVQYRHRAAAIIRRHLWQGAALTAAIVILIMSGFFIGLHHKIPHIFTPEPHLTSLVPTLPDYLDLLGTIWLLAGVIGLILLARQAISARPVSLQRLAFVATTGAILLLSQGPRFFFDIPPVRALLYGVVPLSITAAYCAGWVWNARRLLTANVHRRLVEITLLVVLTVSLASSVSSAYQLSHSIRTNSTLTAEGKELADQLASLPAGGVLVDDYNRRSASWLILSGQPMFTRIAADLAQQMAEASQSPQRRELYLRQLDFEKIFSLGSRPEISDIMDRQNIRYLTGITFSSNDAFSRNPALTTMAEGGDIRLYCRRSACGQPLKATSYELTSRARWLLRTSTLANDIGDREDTYEHLPASLRATRLSEPQSDGPRTFRTTTAPVIPLRFNVGDYVKVLWDKERTGRPDTSLELVVDTGATNANLLSIVTPTGKAYQFPPAGQAVKIDSHDAPWDEEGFVTLTINNPGQEALEIDLIALGLARTP